MDTLALALRDRPRGQSSRASLLRRRRVRNKRRRQECSLLTNAEQQQALVILLHAVTSSRPETMQGMPDYRDQTSFIITTDHGRGSGLEQWKEHGVEQKGSENIWIAVIGPDTEAVSKRDNIPAVTQSQIAATIAGLLGKDFHHAFPNAAAPLPGITSHPEKAIRAPFNPPEQRTLRQPRVGLHAVAACPLSPQSQTASGLPVRRSAPPALYLEPFPGPFRPRQDWPR
jgi:hypothetical protein